MSELQHVTPDRPRVSPPDSASGSLPTTSSQLPPLAGGVVGSWLRDESELGGLMDPFAITAVPRLEANAVACRDEVELKQLHAAALRARICAIRALCRARRAHNEASRLVELTRHRTRQSMTAAVREEGA